MGLLTAALGTLVLLLGGILVLLAGSAVRPTTIRGSWRWAVVAVAGWASVGGATWVVVEPGTLDRLWYAGLVLSLTPLVHVLGARRPVARSWNAFVILPMLAVLGLPLMTTWNTEAGPFEIELPSLLGYLLVLVMGAGNYFGTRFTLPVLWLATGLAFAVVSGSTIRPEWFPEPPTARTVAVALWGLGLFSAGRRAFGAEPEQPADPGTLQLDALWVDFRDLFGIVWAKRVMDRVNESLAAASLDTRLDLDGIHWSDDERAPAESVIVDTFAWLLRRFVDPPWAATYGLELRKAAGDS